MIKSGLIFLALITTAFLTSCSATDSTGDGPNEVNQAGLSVKPIRIGNQAFIAPDVMVDALLKAGLEPTEVASVSSELMQSVADFGGARILTDGNITHAVAVFDSKVYVSGITSGVVVVDNL